MTALARYARLETLGLWRPDPASPPREVVVSFGDATLVLSDGSGLPLAHWSLPAVTRLNPGQTPARFAPDEVGSETLEIEDAEVTAAIETVTRALPRRPRTPRTRNTWTRWLLVALIVLPLAVWLPRALRWEALSVVPPAKRSEIGATLLGLLQDDLGPACRDPLGAEALAKLAERALGPGARAVVLPLGPDRPLALPGGVTVLSREMVERAAEPAVVAGHLLAARAADPDPLAGLLSRAGTYATARLLTSGTLDEPVLAAHARALLSAPAPQPDATLLGPAFAQAEVPLTPWAMDRDPSGDAVGALLNADPYRGAEAPLLLADTDWVALQEICQGS